ncbi:MAG: type II toxin-antitoxin system Phd/YefM family antitoxin [Collinsella sp.]|nr:type II toxin-antitoxin system Phd/YefM family antitoxin [Collinsella sp.]
MPTAVPVRDMKDTAAFSALIERERDVTVTRNGYEAFHCLSAEEWASQRDEVAKAKLLSRIMLAEQEIANGEYEDYDTFAARIKAEYDL